MEGFPVQEVTSAIIAVVSFFLGQLFKRVDKKEK